MNNIDETIYELNRIDNLTKRNLWVNTIHPLFKLVLTLSYILILVSFHKYDIVRIIPMFVYPFLMFTICALSFKNCLKRIKLILPLLLFVGIFNPVFDKTPLNIYGLSLNMGYVSMLTLMLKGIGSILASYILITTTTIDDILYSMRILHIPKIFVTTIMLMFRYIQLLLDEVNQITQAYSLRAPRQKGINIKAWGTLVGQLLLRSIDRSTIVYESMLLRGYTGNYMYRKSKSTITCKACIFILLWIVYFVLCRRYYILIEIGNLIGGIL